MIIYKATNLINGKYYIGKTTQSLEKRINQHKGSSIKGKFSIFYSAIRKYGIENFKWEILAKCTNIETLNKLEIYFISKNIEGYNIGKGGNGGDTLTNHPNKLAIYKSIGRPGKKLSEEHKRKIGLGNKNVSRDNSHLQNKEVIRKRSESRKISNKLNPVKFSEITKAKISKALKGKSKPPRSKEHIEKLLISNRTIDKAAKIRGKSWEDIYGKEYTEKIRTERSNKKAMNNNIITKYVEKEKISSYLLNGWIMGFKKK